MRAATWIAAFAAAVTCSPGDESDEPRFTRLGGILFVGGEPCPWTAAQLGVDGAKDLLAMPLLGEGEVHPLDEALLENPGPCGDYVHPEEPKIGLKLLVL